MNSITHFLMKTSQAFSLWWRQLKAYQKVLVFVVAFVVAIVVLQLLLGTGPTQTSAPSASTAPEPTLALPPASVLRQLPHEGDGFIVAYNEPTQEYLITVTEPPYETSVQRAYDWLKKQSITPETHAIRETWSRFKQYR